MRILVTGASGFIGSHLVAKLVAEGHTVRTFGRSRNLPAQWAELGIEHSSGEITDREAVTRALEDRELVFHLAGLVSYRKSDRKRQYEVNVAGTRTIMELCLEKGISRVVHTGSIAGMGIPEPGTVGTEEMRYNLAGLGLNYCDTKYEAEEEVHRCIRKGLSALILNPGIILGEGDTHPHHRAIFTALSKGWLMGCPSGGVSFCDIQDVVGAHVSAITRGRPGERYALTSANLTFREATCIVARVLECPEPRFAIPGPLLEATGVLCEAVMPLFGRAPSLTRQVAWLSQRCIFFSAEKAIKELGYSQTPFEETIRRTAPYYLGLNGKGESTAVGQFGTKVS